jgi:hypothetical protein
MVYLNSVLSKKARKSSRKRRNRLSKNRDLGRAGVPQKQAAQRSKLHRAKYRRLITKLAPGRAIAPGQ